VSVSGDEYIDTCCERQSDEVVVVGIERMGRRGWRKSRIASSVSFDLNFARRITVSSSLSAGVRP
jgi:hypothetical protein